MTAKEKIDALVTEAVEKQRRAVAALARFYREGTKDLNAAMYDVTVNGTAAEVEERAKKVEEIAAALATLAEAYRNQAAALVTLTRRAEEE